MNLSPWAFPNKLDFIDTIHGYYSIYLLLCRNYINLYLNVHGGE
jgi:hypothetical protein